MTDQFLRLEPEVSVENAKPSDFTPRLTTREGGVTTTRTSPERILPTLGEVARPIMKPESMGDYAIQTAVSAPLIYGGGAGLGALARGLGMAGRAAAAAPVAGRIATTGGLAKARGETNEQALLDMLVSLGGEGLLSAASHAAGGVAGAAKSLDTIKGWVGKGADKDTNLKLLDVVTKRAREAATPAELHQVLQNGRQQLNQLYKGAGDAWVRHVVNAKLPHLPHWLSPRVPLGASKAAGAVEHVAGSGVTKSVADAALGKKDVSPLAAAGALGLAKHVPGTGRAIESLEEAME